MNRWRNRHWHALIALVAVTAVMGLGADQPLPDELAEVGIEEKLGEAIDLDLTFVAEDGHPVALREYFQTGRPVILNLVYFECPMLCTLVLNGQTSTLREIPWMPGEEFEILTISINPMETFDMAAIKKQSYLESYERPAPGWHFLTDHQGNVKKLAEQVGFHYRYDEGQQQYAHAAAIMVLTGEGKVSRYLYGIKFRARDLRLALTEASGGKVGSTVDRVLLYCYQYDPTTRSYVLLATNIMRAGGALAILILGLGLWRLWRHERLRSSGGELARVR